MEELLVLLDRAYECAQRVRSNPELYPQTEYDRAECNARWFAAKRIADTLQWLNQATRVCPGPYWRTWEDVHLKMQQQKKRKRPLPKTECQASEKHVPTFERAALGPPRPDGGECLICDACYQQLGKDRASGYLIK